MSLTIERNDDKEDVGPICYWPACDCSRTYCKVIGAKYDVVPETKTPVEEELDYGEGCTRY